MDRRSTDPVIEAELEQLKSMPIVGLRARWRAKFKSEPPKAFGPDLLRRSIAYKLQEDAYGGLDRATVRLLKQLMALCVPKIRFCNIGGEGHRE